MIFVFGSNEAGIHGAGAARVAYQEHGALFGYGYGHVGNSFAIPTKDRTIQKTLSLETIGAYVTGFLTYARGRPDLEFQITRIGCGLAGLQDPVVAAMFCDAPSNCLFDKKWEGLIPGDKQYNYWGTF